MNCSENTKHTSMKKDKGKEEGEVGVTFAKRVGSGTETVYPEEHPSSPAFSSSSKPPSFIARVSSMVSDTEKEHLYDHDDVASNILPVVELPPPPGKYINIYGFDQLKVKRKFNHSSSFE